ncbi:MAG: M1 family metallopeptidase [Planctomycetota bacterium]
MIPSALVALLLVAPALQDSTPALPSGGELLAEQAAFDVEHVTLELTIDPEGRTIDGTMSLNARCVAATKRVFLDLDHPLEVRRVLLRGEEVKAKRRDGRIEVPCRPPLEPGQDFGVVVEYGGTPRVAVRAPWDGGFTWAETEDGRPWFTTTCQGEGADLWWPCKDHPSDKPDGFDLFARVPEGLIVASNGVLVSSDTQDGWTTFHWHTENPIANYNVALNVAPYERLDRTFESIGGETVPLSFWALPESVERARALLPEIERHLAFFERRFGPYPFRNEKYGVVETPHLGMEHQTIIAYGYDFQQHPKYGYDWLHHHELSHEWWGNLVTCRDWKDMWIHEGFGTYCQALYVEELHGQEAYHATIAEHRRSISNQGPLAPRGATNSKEIYFGSAGKSSNDIYYKGSAVLHTLRWLIGDDAFLLSLARMCYPTEEQRQASDGSQVRFVDTEDYVAIAEELAETELDWFFEAYVREAQLPTLDVKRSSTKLRLRWESPSGAFPMPVPVRVGDDVVRVACPKGRGSLDIPRGVEVEVDPERWVLRAD